MNKRKRGWEGGRKRRSREGENEKGRGEVNAERRRPNLIQSGSQIEPEGKQSQHKKPCSSSALM